MALGKGKNVVSQGGLRRPKDMSIPKALMPAPKPATPVEPVVSEPPVFAGAAGQIGPAALAAWAMPAADTTPPRAQSREPSAAINAVDWDVTKSMPTGKRLVAKVVLGDDGEPNLEAIFDRISDRLGDDPKLMLAKDGNNRSVRFYAQQHFNLGEIRLSFEPVPAAELGPAAELTAYWGDKYRALESHVSHLVLSYDLVQPFADHTTMAHMIAAAVECSPAIAVNWTASAKTIEAGEYVRQCNAPDGIAGLGKLLWWGLSAVRVKGAGGEAGVLISTNGLDGLGFSDIECATTEDEYQASARFVQGVAVHMVEAKRTVPDGHVEDLPFANGLTRTVRFRHMPSFVDAKRPVIRLVW